MSARILVADDEPMNVKLLEARLGREYFNVITAHDGIEAWERAREEAPDLFLLDAMMPRMDGFETCRRIKSDPDLGHIPVVIVTSLIATEDRVRGLEAGADDFLTKPVDDAALMTRVRSLVRMKMATDELRLRLETGDDLGLAPHGEAMDEPLRGQVLIVEDREIEAANMQRALADDHDVRIVSEAEEATIVELAGKSDLVVISLALRAVDALRLCARLRGDDGTRRLPILALVPDTPEQRRRRDTGLELGVNDYVMRPVDAAEFRARVRTQLRRRRSEQRLRLQYRQNLELAVTDGLTGLHNRTYLEAHLERMLARRSASKPVSMLMIDVDHFKRVNDSHGHIAGDEVLRQMALRIERVVRGVDLSARYGGEEFVVVMPDMDTASALSVGERLRTEISGEAFPVSSEPGRVPVTVSIGVATTEHDGVDAISLFRRADAALYRAKDAGRDRVVAASPG